MIAPIGLQKQNRQHILSQYYYNVLMDIIMRV